MVSFPVREWTGYKAVDKSCAFEAFYENTPRFEETISSVKWGKWWPGNDNSLKPN